MTVVLALRCANGIVVGSDSQITDGVRHFGPDEVEDVRTQVRRWVELENRALEELFD